MNIKSWVHRNGFRSPTELQLTRWEFDGGNQKDFEGAILFEGRLYDNQAALLKARVERGVKKIALFLQKRLESRVPSQSNSPQLTT